MLWRIFEDRLMSESCCTILEKLISRAATKPRSLGCRLIVAVCSFQFGTPQIGPNRKFLAICQDSLGLVGEICAPVHVEGVQKKSTSKSLMLKDFNESIKFYKSHTPSR